MRAQAIGSSGLLNKKSNSIHGVNAWCILIAVWPSTAYSTHKIGVAI